jgi:hypothetical protein
MKTSDGFHPIFADVCICDKSLHYNNLSIASSSTVRLTPKTRFLGEKQGVFISPWLWWGGMIRYKRTQNALTGFVDNPTVPLDNNQAERERRGPVVGRKNYYGSGAKWAGPLAAMLFRVFETLEVWNINPRVWLTAYRQGGAKAGGKVPADVKSFLPWPMSQERKKEGILEKTAEDSS